MRRELRHGTEANYRKGCRCADCTVFHSDYLEGRAPERLELVDARPWRVIIVDIAERMDTAPERLIAGCGLSERVARGILTGRYRRITTYTDARLRKLLVLLPSEDVHE